MRIFDKPTIPEVLPLYKKLYSEQLGCCLYVYMKNNYRNYFLHEAVLDAQKKQHIECEKLANLLLKMSMTQRRRIDRYSI